MQQLIEAGPEDFSAYAAQVLEIERASFPSPWSLSAFKAEAEKKEVSHLWVLTSDGIVEGYICFWVLAGEVHLLNLAVHPERRERGLGQGLLIKMIDKGASEGAKSAWLEVRPSNLKARNLYKRVGFKEVGIRPNYYSETKEDAIVMSLALPAQHGLESCPPD